MSRRWSDGDAHRARMRNEAWAEVWATRARERAERKCKAEEARPAARLTTTSDQDQEITMTDQVIDNEPRELEVIEHTPETLPAPVFAKPDALPDLDSLQPGVSLTPKYLKFEGEGAKFRAMFCGFNSMNSQQGGRVPLAMFQTAEGVYVHAGANLVNQLRPVPPQTAVEITYTGKVKTGSGMNVHTFDVRLLKAGGKPSAPAPSAAGAATPPPWPWVDAMAAKINAKKF